MITGEDRLPYLLWRVPLSASNSTDPRCGGGAAAVINFGGPERGFVMEA